MKKYLFFLFISFICISVSGQEFIFPIVFQDAAGNKDTLHFGYDENATDSVDAAFGEENIIDTPYDSVFDVRISNEFVYRSYLGKPAGSFHLEKQIVSINCPGYSEPIAIDIKCQNWPVTATWDSTIWKPDCRAGSLITGMPQGYWWDVTGPSNLYYYVFAAIDSITFTANYEGDWGIGGTAYIADNNDTISVYWVVFSDPSLRGSVNVHEIEQSPQLSVYPNPGRGEFQFVSTTNIEEIHIYNMNGEKVLLQHNSNRIKLHNQPSGMYFYFVQLQNEVTLTGKFMKY